VAVRDTGVGVPIQEQNNIFEKYYRFKRRNDAYEGILVPAAGTGLGLFIAKTIIELHGGGISLVSEQGQGSEFRFTLPINRVEVQNENA